LSVDVFNELRGIKAKKRKDTQLYREQKQSAAEIAASVTVTPDSKKNSKSKSKSKSKRSAYYRVTCSDNGTGMPHNKIPQMLGVVLSSTKYGVKQTRGKFGLGAKMALVWSKKSTGLPIEVWSCQDEDSRISYCKLDIDIYKNTPNVIVHNRMPNDDNWVYVEC
jgi:DNA topoisomerase VI subunit B